jgi:hypothetical protein
VVLLDLPMSIEGTLPGGPPPGPSARCERQLQSLIHLIRGLGCIEPLPASFNAAENARLSEFKHRDLPAMSLRVVLPVGWGTEALIRELSPWALSNVGRQT